FQFPLRDCKHNKVGSFYPVRENFRLTPEMKEKFTRKVALDPANFLSKGQTREPGQTLGNRMTPRLLEVTRDMLYGWRRKIGTAAVVLLICNLAWHVIFGANGLMIYSKKRSEYKALQSEVDRLQHENQELSKEIHNLRTDPKTIEKEAREQLRYARPGEVVFTMPNHPAVPDHSATAQNH